MAKANTLGLARKHWRKSRVYTMDQPPASKHKRMLYAILASESPTLELESTIFTP